MSQTLRETSAEFDDIIAEIAKEPESEFDAVKAWLLGAVRQIKMDALKVAIDQLFAAGLPPDELGSRYRELTAQQDVLVRESQAEMPQR